MRTVNVADWVWSGRIPCVDGYRAVAILAVIASHQISGGGRVWALGHMGVTIFFVISGFLITLLMLRERREFGEVSLAAFYKRRALRILPASIVFFIAVLLMQQIGIYSVSKGTWVRALTYTACFFNDFNSDVLSHMWSLAVEEHFYLLWPLVFVFLRERFAVISLCVYIAITPALNAYLYHLRNPALDPSFCSPTQMSSIAVGCLLAFFVTGRFAPGLYSAYRERPLLVASIAIVVLCGYVLLAPPAVKIPLDDSLKSIVAGIAMLSVIHARSANPIRACLNWRPVAWLGVLSYSLYLWQQPITFSRLPIAIEWLLLLAVSVGSYYLVERPFLSLKARAERVRIPEAFSSEVS